MYKVEKPEGAPEWFVPGIRCKVWNNQYTWEKVVVWFGNNVFIDSKGGMWNHAEPIESWEPVEGEWVAAWFSKEDTINIGKFEKVSKSNSGGYCVQGQWFQYIARITDGLDLRCTPEELKGRTDWK